MQRYRTAIRLFMRVAALCLPMGPILFALKLIDDVVIEGGYLHLALAAYRPATVLLGCLKVSALALPTVAMLSIGMYLLGKLRRDSFVMAFVVGTGLVSVGVGTTLLATVGPSLGMDDLDEPYVRYAATAIIVAIVLAVSALLSALYWLFAVRRDRRRRLLAENDERAIRAME